MAYCKPPPEHRFKPGQSGNPGGKPKGLITKAQIEVIFQQIALKNRDELEALRDDRLSPMLHSVVASAILKAHEKGDMITLEAIMARAVGKVKDEVDTTTRNEDSVVKGIPTEDLLKLVAQDPDKKLG